MNVWTLSLPFFVLSAAFGAALTHWAPSVGGIGTVKNGARPQPALHRAAVALLLVLPLVLAGAVAWSLEKTALHHASRTTLFYAAVGATVAPQIVLHAVLGWALFRRGYFTLPALPRDRVRIGARVAMAVLVAAAVSFMILFLGLSPEVTAYAPVATALVLAMVAVLAAGRWAGYSHHSRPTEMEDSPLRNEIFAVASAFGWAPASLRVYKVRRDDLHASRDEVTRGLDDWRTDFNPMRPALPVELVQEADAGAVTAGMAMRYAHAILLNPFRMPAIRIGFFRLQGMGVALAALFGLGLPIYGLLFFSGKTHLEAAVLAYWSVVLVGFVAALISLRIRGRRYHLYAFRAWQQADTSTVRTPEDFVAALARYDRAMKGLADKEALVNRLKRDRGLMRFLGECGADVPERALQRAREAL